MATKTNRANLVPAIVDAFIGVGSMGAKIAAKVREYLKGLKGDALAQAKGDVLDGIRAKAPRTEKGALCPKAKLPAPIAAAYQAAAMAMSRALRDLSSKGKGGRKARSFAQYSVETAQAAIERGQKAEDTSLELIAAWQALKATAEKVK